MADEMKKVQIMFEQIKSDVKAIAEGHSFLHDKIVSVEDKMDKRFDEVLTIIKKQSETLSEIKYDLRGHIRQSAPPAHIAV
jgi:hypothetical protein